MRSYFDISRQEILTAINSRQELPIQFYDKFKIYPRENASITNINIYLNSLVEEILKSNAKQIKEHYEIDIKDFSYNILVSTNEEVNAFVIKETKPATIIVNIGLLKNVQSEDELAGILAHEVHHVLLRNIIHQSHSSQLGECACDMWSAKAIRNAGYDCNKYADFFRRNKNTETSFFDSHPADTTRIMYIENVNVAMDKKEGLKDSPVKRDTSQIFKNIQSQLPDVKFMTSFEERLEEWGFSENKNAVENLEVLITNIKNNNIPLKYKCSTKPGEARGECFFSLEDTLIPAMEKLYPIPAHLNEVFFGKLIEFKQWLLQDRKSHKEFIKIWDQWIKKNSLCHTHKHYLWRFVSSINFLVTESEGRTYDAVRHHAEIIVKLANAYPTQLQNISHSDFNETIILGAQLKGFNKPGRFDSETSWEQIVQYAIREHTEAKSTDIVRALYIIGITRDPRLQKIKEAEPFKECLILDRRRRGDYYFDDYSTFLRAYDDLNFNDNGQVLTAVDYQRMLEEQQSATIAWEELSEPPIGIGFSAFIEKHSSALRIEFDGRKTAGASYNVLKIFFEKIVNLPAQEIMVLRNGLLLENFIQTYITDYFFKKRQIGSYMIRLDLNNPLIQFVTNEKSSKAFFSSEERWVQIRDQLLLITNYSDEFKKRWNLDNQALFGISSFKTTSELKIFITNYEFKEGLVDTNEHIEVKAINFEVLQFLKVYGNQITLDDITYIEKTLRIKFEKYSIDWFIKSDIHHELAKIKKRMIDDVLALPGVEVSTLQICIETYTKLNFTWKKTGPIKDGHTEFFLNSPKLEQKLLDKILSLLEQLQGQLSNVEAINCCEKIIFPQRHEEVLNVHDSSRYSYNPPFTDRKKSSHLFSIYASRLAAHLNKDNGSDEFRLQVDKIIKNCDQSSASEILTNFADNVLAQKDLSNYIKDQLKFSAKQFVTDKNRECDAIFRIVEQMSARPAYRKAFLVFLTKEVTEESCYELFNKSKDAQTFSTIHYLSKAYMLKMELMHNNFWQLPELVRAGLMQKLLYTQSDDSKKSKKTKKTKNEVVEEKVASQAQQFVFDTVLPRASREDYSEERKIIHAYIKVSKPAEQKVILSVILASNKPGADRGSRGAALKTVLNFLGPAGTKLSQAIGSHPETPESLRFEMNKTKSMSDKPTRWELFELLEEAYPHDDILYVDEILGAGTYGITVHVLKKDNSNTAITLLRPHVASRAAMEFDTLNRAADQLVETDKKYQPVIDMLKQAQASAEHETNMDLANEQDKIAGELYNNVSVTITEGGQPKTFYFFKADWVGYSNGYKETAIIPGDHFIDLNVSPQEKRQLAIAILTVEIKNIISGQPFDHDRHGAQQRIVGNHIGQFDFGGITQKPTAEQKTLLGQIMASVMRAVKEGKPLVKSLRDAIAAIRTNEINKNYLGSIERAILALNDYVQFVNKEDLESILNQVKTFIDPLVEKSLVEKLGKTWFIRNFTFAKDKLSIVVKKGGSIESKHDNAANIGLEKTFITACNGIEDFLHSLKPKSLFFDPQPRKKRATSYLTLLKTDDFDESQKLFVLYGLLTHSERRLRELVSRALGFSDYHKASLNIIKIIKTTTQMSVDEWISELQNFVLPMQQAIDNKQLLQFIEAQRVRSHSSSR